MFTHNRVANSLNIVADKIKVGFDTCNQKWMSVFVCVCVCGSACMYWFCLFSLFCIKTFATICFIADVKRVASTSRNKNSRVCFYFIDKYWKHQNIDTRANNHKTFASFNFFSSLLSCEKNLWPTKKKLSFGNKNTHKISELAVFCDKFDVSNTFFFYLRWINKSKTAKLFRK